MTDTSPRRTTAAILTRATNTLCCHYLLPSVSVFHPHAHPAPNQSAQDATATCEHCLTNLFNIIAAPRTSRILVERFQIVLDRLIHYTPSSSCFDPRHTFPSLSRASPLFLARLGARPAQSPANRATIISITSSESLEVRPPPTETKFSNPHVTYCRSALDHCDEFHSDVAKPPANDASRRTVEWTDLYSGLAGGRPTDRRRWARYTKGPVKGDVSNAALIWSMYNLILALTD